MDDRQFLEDIKNGKISIDEGLLHLKNSNYTDLGFAKIDFDRKKRKNNEENYLRSSLHRARKTGIYLEFLGCFAKEKKIFLLQE